MYPLASQSSPASTQHVEAQSMALKVQAIAPQARTVANDNETDWKPNLLVQRRRRHNRRAVR